MFKKSIQIYRKIKPLFIKIFRRKEIVNAAKHEFLTSHIMGRSFASNYCSKIETALLMNITGHNNRSIFLVYIGT